MGNDPRENRPFCTWNIDGGRPAHDARTYITEALHALGADKRTTDVARSCVSELTANATEHALGPVWMSTWIDRKHIAVHITDSAPHAPVEFPAWEEPREISLEEFDAMPGLPSIERGRGLSMVVQDCLGHCGVFYSAKTKTVWFAVPAPWMPEPERMEWWHSPLSPLPALRVRPALPAAAPGGHLHAAPFPHMRFQEI